MRKNFVENVMCFFFLYRHKKTNCGSRNYSASSESILCLPVLGKPKSRNDRSTTCE